MIFTAYKGANLGDLSKLALSSTVGTYGMGFYFGDHLCAKEYADDGYILEANIHLSNPVRYNAVYDSATDNYAIKLIEQLFPVHHHQHESELLKADYNYLGVEFQRCVADLGYDGIVVEYDDAAHEVIAFSASTIEYIKLSRITADRTIENETSLNGINTEALHLLLNKL